VRLRARLVAWMEQTHDALLDPRVRKQIGEGLKASWAPGRRTASGLCDDSFGRLTDLYGPHNHPSPLR
jgi:hypothetical protein